MSHSRCDACISIACLVCASKYGQHLPWHAWQHVCLSSPLSCFWQAVPIKWQEVQHAAEALQEVRVHIMLVWAHTDKDFRVCAHVSGQLCCGQEH